MNKLYYAGLDVGLHKTAICVMDETGVVVDEQEVASEVDVIDEKLISLELDYKLVGLETDQLSIYLSRSLRDMGWELVCMDARQVTNKGEN